MFLSRVVDDVPRAAHVISSLLHCTKVADVVGLVAGRLVSMLLYTMHLRVGSMGRLNLDRYNLPDGQTALLEVCRTAAVDFRPGRNRMVTFEDKNNGRSHQMYNEVAAFAKEVNQRLGWQRVVGE